MGGLFTPDRTPQRGASGREWSWSVLIIAKFSRSLFASAPQRGRYWQANCLLLVVLVQLLSRLLDLGLVLAALSATTAVGYLTLSLILRGIEHNLRPPA